MQRRHQKVWEEGPSPALNADAARRDRRHRRARPCASCSYFGAGTVEFLYENGKFYFIEMNTRIQVEHPVTEMITGIDLVNEQIKIAAGGAVDVHAGGGALLRPRHRMPHQRREPSHLRPSPGRITYYHPPGGLGVRVDSRGLSGLRDPAVLRFLVGKLIVHGSTRNECLMRLRRALDEFIVDGIDTTLPLFRALVRNPDIQNGDYDIHWLEHFLETAVIGEGAA